MKELNNIYLVKPIDFDRGVIINEFEEGDLIGVVRIYSSSWKISSIEFYFRTNNGYKKLNKEVRFNCYLSTFNIKFIENIIGIYFLLCIIVFLLIVHLFI